MITCSMNEHDLMNYGIVARPLLLKDVVPWKGLPFGRDEPKRIYTRPSDRAVKGVQEAHWDVVASPE